MRELAVREMLARTIKVLIRDGLSFLVEPDEEDAKAVVVHYLNECLTRVESDAHVTIWKYIDELLFKKYAFSTGTGATGTQVIGLSLSLTPMLPFEISTISTMTNLRPHITLYQEE